MKLFHHQSDPFLGAQGAVKPETVVSKKEYITMGNGGSYLDLFFFSPFFSDIILYGHYVVSLPQYPKYLSLDKRMSYSFVTFFFFLFFFQFFSSCNRSTTQGNSFVLFFQSMLAGRVFLQRPF